MRWQAGAAAVPVLALALLALQHHEVDGEGAVPGRLLKDVPCQALEQRQLRRGMVARRGTRRAAARMNRQQGPVHLAGSAHWGQGCG